MTRRLRRAACVLLLGVWVAAGCLDVRSDRHAMVAEWRRVGRVFGVDSRSSRLTAYTTTYPPGEVTVAAGFRWYQTEATGPAAGEPFYYGPGRPDPAYAEAGVRRSEARVPYWFVMLCAACLPTWRLAAHLVRRHRVDSSHSGGFAVI